MLESGLFMSIFHKAYLWIMIWFILSCILVSIYYIEELMISNPLPIPHPDIKALSDNLLSQIIAEIKENHAISFARYMALALYAPQLGYYRNGLKKFGVHGDFVTAPEISPLFSYCLANQCADILSELHGGDILELGAGSGVMAADILLALQKKNCLPRYYYILELSGFLKAQQYNTIQKKIPDYVDRVIWLTALPNDPIYGVVLANEVLDAMPVNVFTYQHGIKECGVTYANNNLTFCILEKENQALISAIKKYNIAFSENYTSEINLYLPGWIKSISNSVASGALLIVDYGFPRHEYYHPERSFGTLMCHYQHHAHANSLIYPGIQDITSHVDFTAIAEAADENNFDVAGYANQATFLINCGLLLEKTHHQQIMRLTSPNEMGELFKVIALTKNIKKNLMGFKMMNQLEKL